MIKASSALLLTIAAVAITGNHNIRRRSMMRPGEASIRVCFSMLFLQMRYSLPPCLRKKAATSLRFCTVLRRRMDVPSVIFCGHLFL